MTVFSGDLTKRADELIDLTRRLATLHTPQDVLVARARAAGATSLQVADALGVTPQAAHNRYRDLKLESRPPLRDRRLPL